MGVAPSSEQSSVASAPSNAHSNVAPARLEVNSSVALEASVGSAGPEVIVVSGAGRTVHVWLAGVWSTLPAASLARTRKLCTPADRSVSWTGELHELNDSPSTAHSKLEPASLDENTRVALVLSESEGAESELIVVSGAVVSGGAWTVQT